MKIRFDTQNFKGYSNIIHADEKCGETRNALIALKLNNEGGFRDLDEFKAVKRMYENSENKINDDVLVILYNKISEGADTIFLGDEPLFWGDELEELRRTFPKEQYKSTEAANLKAYTLLANLTKRIMQKGKPDNSISDKVSDTCTKVLFAISSNYQAADSFVKRAKQVAEGNNEAELKATAKDINLILDKTMKSFFK